jgi:hypothetical protein
MTVAEHLSNTCKVSGCIAKSILRALLTWMVQVRKVDAYEQFSIIPFFENTKHNIKFSQIYKLKFA